MAILPASTRNRLALALSAAAIVTAAKAAPHQARVCRGSAALTQAKAGLAEGDDLVRRHHLRQASKLFERHVNVLIDYYGLLHPTILDDSGTHLALYHYMERQGELRRVVRLKREMLAEEIKMCGEDEPEPPPQISKSR